MNEEREFATEREGVMARGVTATWSITPVVAPSAGKTTAKSSQPHPPTPHQNGHTLSVLVGLFC
jgi:hypothetical protein